MILQGDALTVLRTLADESVHCCITSPPYWGPRDYGWMPRWRCGPRPVCGIWHDRPGSAAARVQKIALSGDNQPLRHADAVEHPETPAVAPLEFLASVQRCADLEAALRRSLTPATGVRWHRVLR